MNQQAHVYSRPVFSNTQQTFNPNILSQIQQRKDLWPQVQRLLQQPIYTPESNNSRVQPNPTIINQHKRVVPSHNNLIQRQRIMSNQNWYGNSHVGIQRKGRSIVDHPPKTHSRIEYVPYIRKYYQMEAQEVVNVVYVPVERIRTQYYAVQHLTEYKQVPYEETIIEYVPEEKINMKVQYQLVEKKIVHYPKDESIESTNIQSITNLQSNNIKTKLINVEEMPVQYNTNYVTSDVPSYKISLDTEVTHLKERNMSRLTEQKNTSRINEQIQQGEKY